MLADWLGDLLLKVETNPTATTTRYGSGTNPTICICSSRPADRPTLVRPRPVRIPSGGRTVAPNCCSVTSHVRKPGPTDGRSNGEGRKGHVRTRTEETSRNRLAILRSCGTLLACPCVRQAAHFSRPLARSLLRSPAPVPFRPAFAKGRRKCRLDARTFSLYPALTSPIAHGFCYR